MSHSALLTTLALLAELQKERGIALMTDGARTDATDVPLFDEQEARTHNALTAAQKNNGETWLILPERFFESLAQRVHSAFRDDKSHGALIEWYLFNLENPIYQLTLSHLTNETALSPSQIGAFVHYVASLGFLGHLRDCGLAVYGRGALLGADVRKMAHIAQSCLSRERLFLGLADEKVRQWMNEARGPADAVVGQIDQTLRRIKDSATKGVLAETTMPAWLTLFNEEISLRHDALQKTLERIFVAATEELAAPAAPVSLESDVESKLEGLRSHPLFRGLSDTALRSILRGAKVVSIEKNSVLFSQGDAVNRFFIVLDGWAKSVKMTAEGQEAVVQILGRRDCLLDQGLAESGMASLTLRAVTKCVFLALATSSLSEQIAKSREFSANLLALSLMRLQRLVGQFEQVTVRTAEQRVGWFLINLHLETGLEGEPLKLPFDKALIASYLNIKPETFSRVLQHFRKKGFVIDKHKVVMPNPHALCAYCEPEMALRCCRAEAANCAPLQALKRGRKNV